MDAYLKEQGKSLCYRVRVVGLRPLYSTSDEELLEEIDESVVEEESVVEGAESEEGVAAPTADKEDQKEYVSRS